jgi:hypothetical protein
MNRALLHVIILTLACAGLATAADSQPQATSPNSLAFARGSDGGFVFDTGVLRGKLRADGKSMGLTGVIHIPSGKRLDRSNGLFSHYRVFTKGMRYGGGAWDWPSDAELTTDGSVQVRWPSTAQRPFQMRALYRWRTPDTLDLETAVQAEKDLIGFESFLASYLSEGFTNAAVYAAASAEAWNQAGFLRLRSAAGTWQMFPRDEKVLPVIQDGRWRLEPNPVNWTIRTRFDSPLAYRRDPSSGLTVVFMSSPADCFAIAGPEESEGHYSMYLSLFGRDLKAGEAAVARARLVVSPAVTDQQMADMEKEYAWSLR